MSELADRLATWAASVKFEHTLFSLPLLFAGAVVAPIDMIFKMGFTFMINQQYPQAEEFFMKLIQISTD